MNANSKTKSMCMAFSCMGTCEKDEWHDLQRIGNKHDFKEFQHIILTLSYQSEWYDTSIFNQSRFTN